MKKPNAPIILLTCLALFPLMAAAKSDSSHLNRMRTEVGRALVAADANTWQSVLAYYTPDVEYSDPVVKIHGVEQMAQFLGMFFSSSPNLVTTVEDEICIDDIYTATWTMAGSFSGVPYEAKGVTVIKFVEKSAQAYYQKDYYSEGDIMAAIPGLDQALQGFRTYYRCFVDPTYDCPLPPMPPAQE